MVNSEAGVGDEVLPAPQSREQPREQSTRHRWLRRAVIALAVAAYYLLWAVTAFDKVNPTDLDVFFLPATRIALEGHPLHVYQLRVGLIYPNANGPLSLIPLTFAAWLAQVMGWAGDVMLRRMLVFAVCAPFPLLAAWEGARVMERFGPRLRGVWAALPYLALALAPELWLSALYYGHIEQVIAVWLTLAAVRKLQTNRWIPAGALLGLALLARSDISMIILALAVVLLARGRWRGALVTMGSAGVTVLACLAPFLIADAHDTLFSLMTFRSALPVGGGNIWSLVPASHLTILRGPQPAGSGTAWDPLSTPNLLALGQRYDAIFALVAALLVTLIFLAIRRDVDVRSPDLYGILTLASLCFALFIKTLWPYYFLESALFATVWALARSSQALEAVSGQKWERWLWGVLAWVPRGAILACAFVAEAGLEANNYSGWQRPWGQMVAGFILVTMALILIVGASRPDFLPVSDHREDQPERDILAEMTFNVSGDR